MVAFEGSDRPKVDLVLEGGGVKGIGLVGAVLTLSGSGYVFPRVAGTSAGAIVAALVAALKWWSTFEASWAQLTVFDRAATQLDLVTVGELTVGVPEVIEAATFLGLVE